MLIESDDFIVQPNGMIKYAYPEKLTKFTQAYKAIEKLISDYNTDDTSVMINIVQTHGKEYHNMSLETASKLLKTMMAGGKKIIDIRNYGFRNKLRFEIDIQMTSDIKDVGSTKYD